MSKRAIDLPGEEADLHMWADEAWRREAIGKGEGDVQSRGLLIDLLFTDWGRYDNKGLSQEAKDYYYRRGAAFGIFMFLIAIISCCFVLSLWLNG